MKSTASRVVASAKRDRAFSITTVVVIILAAALLLSTIHVSKGPQQHQAMATTSPSPVYPDYSVLKNLTYVDLYSTRNGTLTATIPVISVRSIGVSLSSRNISVNQTLYINVTYNGTFNFNNYNVTAFLRHTVNVYYFGYYQNGTNRMYVYDNRPGSERYFRSVGSSTVSTPPNASLASELRLSTSAAPTANATGKAWFVCGGVFIAYSNDTNWTAAFNNLTYNMKDAGNSTVTNQISGDCQMVNVR